MFARVLSHVWLFATPWTVAHQALLSVEFYRQEYRFCCCSVTQSCRTLCDPMDYSMPGFRVLHSLPELAQTHVHWVGDAIQPFHPVIPFSSAFSLSQHQGFSNESALHIRWPKDWSFSFSISPSNEYSGLISFRIDWLDLLAVQGTLKSFLQHHSSKASILWFSVFFIREMENGPRPEVEVVWRSTEAKEEYLRRDKSGGIFK